ncbi:AAA family ATPase [Actinomadura fulvescens]|uniref:nucleotide-binding protein n=1 Tax=Actinomadura fulvescens TaxID=46160 RepID=UPI0031D58168
MAKNDHDGRSLEERLASLDAMNSEAAGPAAAVPPSPGTDEDEATPTTVVKRSGSPPAPMSQDAAPGEPQADDADAEPAAGSGPELETTQPPSPGAQAPPSDAELNPWLAAPPLQEPGGAGQAPPPPGAEPGAIPPPPGFPPYGELPAPPPYGATPPPFEGPQQPYDGSPMPQPFDGGMLPPPYGGFPSYDPAQMPPYAYEGGQASPPPHDGNNQLPQPPYEGGPQPPYEGVPQPPYEGAPQPPYERGPQPPYEGAPQPPYEGAPQPPYGNAPQPPYEGAPQPPYEGVPQPPYDPAQQTQFDGGPPVPQPPYDGGQQPPQPYDGPGAPQQDAAGQPAPPLDPLPAYPPEQFGAPDPQQQPYPYQPGDAPQPPGPPTGEPQYGPPGNPASAPGYAGPGHPGQLGAPEGHLSGPPRPPEGFEGYAPGPAEGYVPGPPEGYPPGPPEGYVQGPPPQGPPAAYPPPPGQPYGPPQGPPQGPPPGYGQVSPQHQYPQQPQDPESLSSENLLGERRIAPSTGWRRAVYKATAGNIHPGESQAELRRKDLIGRARTNVAGGHHRVAVMSLKGGVGKTTTTTGLGSMLASMRGDRVIAVDANPDRGTLSDKVRLETAATVRDLLNNRDKISRYADVRAFTSQNEARLEVLASDRDPAVSEAFSAEDYSAVAVVLEQYYSICITDCGTGLLHSAMAGVLALADQLVLVSSPSVDGARSASATLDWLEAHDHGHLVRNGVVVLSMVRNRTRSQVDLDKLQAHFESRCRAVVRIPYDDHLEEGAEVALEQLAPPTREAYLMLAAVVGDGFAYQRPTE